ncbi:MAG TPA: hypothetical protein ENK85_09145 [Saprospiraceae bacterium]|nr:hypothetical protein [Saprospiraceae bacterium]
MKIAILDLYNQEPNTGIRAIKELIRAHHPEHLFQIFEIRQQDQWPKISDWDVFISSGGPGDPTESETIWPAKWKHFFQQLMEYNEQQTPQKPAFLICYSFQLFCHHFNLGVASRRYKPSYGSYPCLLSPYGKKDIIFGQLPATFQIADFRSYQITLPNTKNLKKLEAKILAMEKERPSINKAQALMAAQFTPYMYGTQFHPEANGDKVKESFKLEEEKLTKFLGNKTYQKAVEKLENVAGINQTQATVLPRFLDFAMSIVLKNDSKI